MSTDTLMERNNLMSKCYPRIKDYCREKHGLEFQVKQRRRWGLSVNDVVHQNILLVKSY